MITQTDLTKLKTIFATKEELNDLRKSMEKGFDTIIDLMNAYISELNTITQNHEQRITKLEDKAFFVR